MERTDWQAIIVWALFLGGFALFLIWSDSDKTDGPTPVDPIVDSVFEDSPSQADIQKQVARYLLPLRNRISEIHDRVPDTCDLSANADILYVLESFSTIVESQKLLLQVCKTVPPGGQELFYLDDFQVNGDLDWLRWQIRSEAVSSRIRRDPWFAEQIIWSEELMDSLITYFERFDSDDEDYYQDDY